MVERPKPEDHPPSAGEKGKGLLDMGLKAAFDLDPMDTPHPEDSVLAVLGARTGVESRIQLREPSGLWKIMLKS